MLVYIYIYIYMHLFLSLHRLTRGHMAEADTELGKIAGSILRYTPASG